MLDIQKLIKLSEKPNLYEKGTAVMWTDPYISKKLLEIHLNPEVDLASRKAKAINSTIQWVLDRTGKSHIKILDLGCGPGLYTQLLAQKGHQVTGIDFSENSINYARQKAKSINLRIDYRKQDYLTISEIENYDLVLMVYTDFGVLVPEDRAILLSNVYKALKPGGCFIFDVLKDSGMNRHITPNSWESSKSGFWRENPYLVLSNSFLYPDNKAILYQHSVIENDTYDIYRFWTHFFSRKDLEDLLIQNGFHSSDMYDDILNKEESLHAKDIMFCIANKI